WGQDRRAGHLRRTVMLTAFRYFARLAFTYTSVRLAAPDRKPLPDDEELRWEPTIEELYADGDGDALGWREVLPHLILGVLPARMLLTSMIRARIVLRWSKSRTARRRRSPKTSSCRSVTPIGWSSPSWRMLSARAVRSPMSLRCRWPTLMALIGRSLSMAGTLSPPRSLHAQPVTGRVGWAFF